jgi:hypothetical protein
MSDKVEKLARQICEGLDLDPDARVCHMILPEGSSPRGRFVYMPEDNWVSPLWHAYTDVARIALESLEK